MNCPICGNQPSERYLPFCSKRCANVDLGRWLSGRYSISEPISPEGQEEPEPDANKLN
ncbi:MAG: DNA gyrase inhibitor YacG [Rhodobacteraceae bacterium]|nr:DNA gyrase inhibitor YacG [Paracoccaceae bacterium]